MLDKRRRARPEPAGSFIIDIESTLNPFGSVSPWLENGLAPSCCLTVYSFCSISNWLSPNPRLRSFGVRNKRLTNTMDKCSVTNTHRLWDQQTKCGTSLVMYCTTARMKSSVDDSHQRKLMTRNCCSSFMLLNSFHWGQRKNCWLADAPMPELLLTQGDMISFPFWESEACHDARDKSRMHKPREAATAMECPLSFPIAAIRQGPFAATYDDGILDSSHRRETSCVASGWVKSGYVITSPRNISAETSHSLTLEPLSDTDDGDNVLKLYMSLCRRFLWVYAFS